jgi:hypothetical protein
VAEATEAVVMAEEILDEAAAAAAVAEATEAVVTVEEILDEAAAVAEATEAVVMAEEILDEAAAVAEATEAVVTVEEILDEAAAVAMAVVMAEEIPDEATIDVREERTHLEESQKVQNLDTQKERNQVMLTTVDQVKLGRKVTKETEIEVI